jgi:peptidoglycan hydrolase-like protein with peptidoglycan-binding domain
MKTIKLGSNNIDTLFLQASLGLKSLDGSFGAKTKEAVIEYQKSIGVTADGIVGPGTWSKIISSRTTITDKDYDELASLLGINSASLKAVRKVESGKAPFLPSGYPTLLFEAHIFYKYLLSIGKKDPKNFIKAHSNILSRVWNKALYKGGEKEVLRLDEAWNISPTTALYSASFGAFQICGFNWKSCGCSSVNEFVGKMWLGEKQQLEIMGEFLKNAGLVKYLKALNWAGFAKAYNGPEYAKNSYDSRLKIAYNSYSK